MKILLVEDDASVRAGSAQALDLADLQVADFHAAEGALAHITPCLLYTSPSPRDLSTSRMPSSA